MKPPPFTYHAPASVADALDLLREHSDEAKVLAGGQSLVPMLNFRLVLPTHLVDINELPDLDTPTRSEHGWRIPALVRQRAAERSPELAATVPMLHAALTQVAHPQIRNRGTICGSLAHADPAAEMPTVMTALDARMTIASHAGTRVVGADDFFVFHLTSALEPDELLLAVEIPDPPPGTYTSFLEFAPRRGDFCLAAVAASVTFDVNDTVSACRLVAAGVASTPQRLTEAEAALIGTACRDADLAEAAAAARREVSPTGDVHGDATYRRQLVAVLTRRVLADVRTKKEADRV
jgi:carbon-monoxide dehydrogenase medium subunit